jgi:hypothetical protein
VGLTSGSFNAGISFAVSFDTDCHPWTKKRGFLSFPARKLQEVLGSVRAFKLDHKAFGKVDKACPLKSQA